MVCGLSSRHHHLTKAAFAKYERELPNLRTWSFPRLSLNKGFAKLEFAKLGGLLYTEGTHAPLPGPVFVASYNSREENTEEGVQIHSLHPI